MFWIISGIVVLFITYLICKDPTIIHKSISYSYYEDRETAVIWGSFAGTTGIIISFTYPSILTMIAGVSLLLVPIAGDFNKKPITYIHYVLALSFYFLMLLYTNTFYTAIPYVVVSLILLWKRYHKLSLFWIEIIGILVILINLYIKHKI